MHSQLDELIDATLQHAKDCHARGSLAPLAATMNASGEITGAALTNDGTNNISVLEVLNYFETEWRRRAASGEIVATSLWFHGTSFLHGIQPATTIDEACTLVCRLEHYSGESVSLAIPYQQTGDAFEYHLGRLILKPAAVFAAG